MRAARRGRPADAGEQETKKKETPQDGKVKASGAGKTQANKRKGKVPDRELDVNKDKDSIGEAGGIVQKEELVK